MATEQMRWKDLVKLHWVVELEKLGRREEELKAVVAWQRNLVHQKVQNQEMAKWPPSNNYNDYSYAHKHQPRTKTS